MTIRSQSHDDRGCRDARKERVTRWLVVVMFGLFAMFVVCDTTVHWTSTARGIPQILWLLLVFATVMSFIGMLICQVLLAVRVVARSHA